MSTNDSRSDETHPEPGQPARQLEPIEDTGKTETPVSSDYPPEWLETGRSLHEEEPPAGGDGTFASAASGAPPADQPPEEPPPPLRPRFMSKRPDRLSTGLFIVTLLLFIAAALAGSLSPFIRLALAGLGVAFLLGLALRLWVVRNPRWQMESGCPQCGEHELLRVSRHSSDRFLNLMGVPAYRYRCRSCTWEGARLSEYGRIVSPGATIAPTGHPSNPD